MKNLNVLLGFVGGAIVGTAIGLLMAPDKGEVTRKKLCDFADDQSHEAKKKLKTFLDSKGINLHWGELNELVDELIEDDLLAKK